MTNIKKWREKKKGEILEEEKCLPFKFHTSCSDCLNQLICVLVFLGEGEVNVGVVFVIFFLSLVGWWG